MILSYIYHDLVTYDIVIYIYIMIFSYNCIPIIHVREKNTQSNNNDLVNNMYPIERMTIKNASHIYITYAGATSYIYIYITYSGGNDRQTSHEGHLFFDERHEARQNLHHRLDGFSVVP